MEPAKIMRHNTAYNFLQNTNVTFHPVNFITQQKVHVGFPPTQLKAAFDFRVMRGKIKHFSSAAYAGANRDASFSSNQVFFSNLCSYHSTSPFESQEMIELLKSSQQSFFFTFKLAATSQELIKRNVPIRDLYTSFSVLPVCIIILVNLLLFLMLLQLSRLGPPDLFFIIRPHHIMRLCTKAQWILL